MANHKSALKRIRRNEAVKLRNKVQHKATRNAIKKLKDLSAKKKLRNFYRLLFLCLIN